MDLSIENNFASFISFIAFKINAEEPPLKTPISIIFFGFIVLISPWINFPSSCVIQHNT